MSYRAGQLQERSGHLCAVCIDAVVALLLVDHGRGGGCTFLLAELLQHLWALSKRLQELLHLVLRHSAGLLPHIFVEGDHPTLLLIHLHWI